MPLPAKRVKATTYRRDSPEVAKLWLRLLFMQLTRDLFAIAKFLLLFDYDVTLLVNTSVMRSEDGGSRSGLTKTRGVFRPL